jgi:hypothetical protein
MGWVVNVTPPPLYPRGRIAGIHCTGGWVGPRAGLDIETRRKILCRGSNPSRPVWSQTQNWLTELPQLLFRFCTFLFEPPVVYFARLLCGWHTRKWKGTAKFYVFFEVQGSPWMYLRNVMDFCSAPRFSERVTMFFRPVRVHEGISAVSYS